MNKFIKIIQEISHPNKYTKWYINIINNPDLSDKTENHHIVPDCLFINRTRKGPPGFVDDNPNDPENIVKLSLRQHFIVHMLLPKMIIDKNYGFRLTSAIAKLMNNTVNSRTYKTAKKFLTNYSYAKTDESRERASKFMTEYYSSEEGRDFLDKKAEIQRTTMVGEGNPMFGKESGFKNKSHSEEFKTKLKNKTGENHHRTNVPGRTKEYEITTPTGETFIVNNLSKFCKENDLNISGMSEVASGKRSNHRNYKCKLIPKPLAILIDPDKTEHTVFQLKDFCKEHDLYYQCIIHVLNGNKPQHKGWTGYRL
jgi:hypothetical protein